jgi:hypothetical protein
MLERFQEFNRRRRDRAGNRVLEYLAVRSLGHSPSEARQEIARQDDPMPPLFWAFALVTVVPIVLVVRFIMFCFDKADQGWIKMIAKLRIFWYGE